MLADSPSIAGYSFITIVDEVVVPDGISTDVCVFECPCGEIEFSDLAVGYTFGVANALAS